MSLICDDNVLFAKYFLNSRMFHFEELNFIDDFKNGFLCNGRSPAIFDVQGQSIFVTLLDLSEKRSQDL